RADEVFRRRSERAGSRAVQDAGSSLLLVAAVLLSSVVALLVLGSLLILLEVSALVRKAVLLVSIILLALGQTHFVVAMARRLRMPDTRSRIVSLGTATSSLVLLALGALVGRS